MNDLKHKTHLSIALASLAVLAVQPQAAAQLSKFNQRYPSQSYSTSSAPQEKTFAETNAVSWVKPVDASGVSTISTNRSLVSVELGANVAKGTLMGGRILFPDNATGAVLNAQPHGLTSVTIPTIDSTGLITIPGGATGFTANQIGAPGWTYNASFKQGDTPNTSTGIGVIGGGEFSSQEGNQSNVLKAAINITRQGNITANPGQGNGTKVTVQMYTEKTTDTKSGKTEYLETGEAKNNFEGTQFLNQADSLNNQFSYDALSTSNRNAKPSDYIAEENVPLPGGPVTSGGFNIAGGALGDALSFNDAGPAPLPAPANYYTELRSEAGENASNINVSSVASTGPGYANQQDTAGGTDADTITVTNLNNIATGNGGNVLTTEMTTCTALAFECGGGVAVGDTTATYIKVLSDGSFSAFY